MMDGQMTIFDFLKVDDDVCLDDMTDEDLMQKMYEATGLKFVLDASSSEAIGCNYYKCKRKNRVYECYFDNYSFGDKKRFISVAFNEPLRGSASPCDSLSEAIETMQRYLKKE